MHLYVYIFHMYVCVRMLLAYAEKCLSMKFMYVSVCCFICIYVHYICMYHDVCVSDNTYCSVVGCLHDDVCAESESWLVTGMIPVFDKKKSYANWKSH